MSNGENMKCGEPVECLKSDSETNGFAVEVGGGYGSSGGSGSGSESFRTYKRRKQLKVYAESKVAEDERASKEVALADRIVKDSWEENNSCEQASPPTTDCQATVNRSDDCSERNSRNIVLDRMYRILSEDEDGVQGCICEALVFHQKDFVHSDEYKEKCPLQIRNGSWNADGKHDPIVTNGSRNESNHHTVTECQRAFCDILTSKKFASLCKLLHENFQGSKVDSFFDTSIINSRMKDGTYERSPMLFYTDIQQVWNKIQGIGTEMISLSKNLSDMSTMTSYREQFCATKADSHTEQEQTELWGLNRYYTCWGCGEMLDGRDCLVCDSCEDIYHVSCTDPSVEYISSRNWYCASCTERGKGLSHENCVACEKLNTHRTQMKREDRVIPTNEDSFDEPEENSSCSIEDELQLFGDICKVCGTEVDKNDERTMICAHSYCRYKYYHERCLTRKQINMYGPWWFCPSCLCRVCLTDRDDDKIILCDSCDHAYHLYCSTPPLTSIPEGKWFCIKCDANIHEIHKARRAYEKKKKGEEGQMTFENLEMNQSEISIGGMDMLLSAAKTLKDAEIKTLKESL